MERRLLRTTGHDFIRSEAQPLGGQQAESEQTSDHVDLLRQCLISPAESILYNLPNLVQ